MLVVSAQVVVDLHQMPILSKRLLQDLPEGRNFSHELLSKFLAPNEVALFQILEFGLSPEHLLVDFFC